MPFLLFVLLFLPAVAAGAQNILVFGDSLSAGYGLPRESAWPILLEQKLQRENLPYRVVNASISGETTHGGVARIQNTLKLHRPGVVILELGGNDGLRGLPLDATKANLRAMIEASRQAGAKVVLVGVELPPNYGTVYTTKFNSTFRELATETTVPLVPSITKGFGTDRAWFQADGIHPNAAAQPRILDNIWPTLEKTLGETSTRLRSTAGH